MNIFFPSLNQDLTAAHLSAAETAFRSKQHTMTISFTCPFSFLPSKLLPIIQTMSRKRNNKLLQVKSVCRRQSPCEKSGCDLSGTSCPSPLPAVCLLPLNFVTAGDNHLLIPCISDPSLCFSAEESGTSCDMFPVEREREREKCEVVAEGGCDH